MTQSDSRDKPYRVMEFLDESGTAVIGWAFLDESEYKRWKKTPRSWEHIVEGYGVIAGMELMAGTGSVHCARLWDYRHTIPDLPSYPFECSELESTFEPARDEEPS